MSDERAPIERIVDLLDGNLAEDESGRLEATLDADDRRELAGQARVKAALEELPRPMLSADERGRLRAAVRAELRIDEEAGPDRSASRRPRPSWLVRVLPSVAAAATGVAMVAVAVNLVGDGDTGPEAAVTDLDMVVAEQAAPTTAAPPPSLDAPGSGADEDSTAVEALADEAVADRSEAPAATKLADAGMEQTSVADAEEAMLAAAAAGMAEAEAAIEAAEAASEQAGEIAFELTTGRPEEARRIVGELAEKSETAPVPAAELADRATDAGLACWEVAQELAGEEGVILWMARGLVDGAEAEGYLVRPGSGDPSGDDIVALYGYPGCQALLLQ